jgi:single-strand DNA-binding protein
MNINTVAITGNLTHEPDLRHTGSGTAVCNLRVAVNTRRKNGQTGEWEDKANYINVTVWGKRGAACAEYLTKGTPIAVDGRLDWREWEAKDGSGKRQSLEIVANWVEFLGSKDKGDPAPEHRPPEPSGPAEPDLAGAAAGGGEDDISF